MDLSSLNNLENKIVPQQSNNRSDYYYLKRMRSNEEEEEDKVQRTHYLDIMQQGSCSLLSLSTEPNTKMLSFSNPCSQSTFNSTNVAFSHNSNVSHYDYGVHAPVMESGVGGPFTASQWVELQHQALVYKYIQANVTVPSGLLSGLNRSVNPYLLSSLQSASYSYTPNSWGWKGSFQLGFSANSNDPEPGRCRRTDGKKWRCSRDAVLEQKYCERHLNRGRHRSRKLVEGLAGQASVTGKGRTAAATSPSVVIGRVVPEHSHLKELQTRAAADPSTYHVKFNRMSDDQGLSIVNPTTDSKSKDSIFSLPKEHITTEDHSHSDFGILSSDTFLNPSIKTSYMNNTTSFDPIIPFMNGPDRPSWPEEMKSDWTQLSMSIPMSSSPRNKMMLSPLSLSHELEQKEKNWGNSMGGPLGEVLLNKPSSWSSPTGVLQKADFRSLSNSSNGSSPRGEDMFGTHLTTSMFLPSL